MAFLATFPSNLVCTSCHFSEIEVHKDFVPCPFCNTFLYCSARCLAINRTEHTPYCQPPTDTDETQLPVWFDSVKRTLATDPDTFYSADMLYYVKQAIPHRHKISIVGPFTSREAIIAQVLRFFGNECEYGRTRFLNYMSYNDAVVSMSCTMNGKPNEIKRVTVLREINPIMAVRLPGPAWFIMVSRTLRNVDGLAMTNDPVPSRSFLDEDILSHGTYATLETAIMSAWALARDLAADELGVEVVNDMANAGMEHDHLFMTGVAVRKHTGLVYKYLITVMYDDGEKEKRESSPALGASSP